MIFVIINLHWTWDNTNDSSWSMQLIFVMLQLVVFYYYVLFLEISKKLDSVTIFSLRFPSFQMMKVIFAFSNGLIGAMGFGNWVRGQYREKWKIAVGLFLVMLFFVCMHMEGSVISMISISFALWDGNSEYIILPSIIWTCLFITVIFFCWK